MTPLLGFTPDAARTAEGIITDCSGIIPYQSGMEAAPSQVDAGYSALAAAAVYGVVYTKLDGSNRIFAATGDRIYELVGSTWTDRSAGGSAYTTTASWTSTQFGDATIFAGGTANTLQASTAGAFAAISGAPKAKIVFSVVTGAGGFVIAANTDSTVDTWECSGLNDHTAWTDSTATQSNSGRLLGNDQGAITAGCEFGDAALIFKARTMFVGRYVGVPDTFQWYEVPGGAGCVGPNAYCVVPGVGVFFVGPDQFWLFDGARPIPLADNQLRQWFYTYSNANERDNIRVVFEAIKNRIWVFYASSNSTGALDAYLVYHLVSKQWGKGSMTIEAPLIFIQPSITMDNVTGTMDDPTLPDMDSGYWNPSARYLAVINSSHKLATLTGTPSASWFVTEDFGDEWRASHLIGMRLRYETVPSSATATGYTLDEAGDSATLAGTISASDTPSGALNKFDLRQRGKFHRVRFDFTGNVRIIGKQPKLLPAGER